MLQVFSDEFMSQRNMFTNDTKTNTLIKSKTSCDVVHYEFLPTCHTVNKEYYLSAGLFETVSRVGKNVSISEGNEIDLEELRFFLIDSPYFLDTLLFHKSLDSLLAKL